jgi:hypothetical protein
MKIIKKLFNFIFELIKYKINLFKYSKNSYSKSFNWDWESINYNRIALVNLAIQSKTFPKYLEIGCGADNSLFDSIYLSQKIGVDPYLGGNFKGTSNEFFSQNKFNFDIIFIDGLHTFNQIRLDIINSLNCINDDGLILLHDMLPRNWVEQHVPNISRNFWTGDVWKVAFELIKTSGIDFRIVKIDFGVGIIKVLNKNVALVDLSRSLSGKQFQYFYENIDSLPIINWEEAYCWIQNR